ncbi:helix-turn-helix transcriptional regulator [Microvirga sp. BT689]|uniref:helix-turn-helix domain-containing protein n=1 Tax=Microvirga arvi TaxID=2778731 RepID=UPI00194EC43C|nr:helix-turn-helix transcriptional regulator [Microvirga arvi]MBM6583003.1 helix-turn-helix transcriptional regulator [Microvirga arvi]
MPSPRRTDLPQSRQSRQSLTEEVEHLLRGKLIRDTCTADMLASLYSVSRRTMYRHLKAEGRTFQQVANGVRCEIACTLIAETDLSFRQIAEILNYSEASAFTRAFSRWTGQPPSAWRSTHLGLTGWSGRRPHARLRRHDPASSGKAPIP